MKNCRVRNTLVTRSAGGAFLLVAFVAGCASIASGAYGTNLDATGRPTSPVASPAGLKISAGENAYMSSAYFGEIELTFENPTPAWIHIQQVQLDFGSALSNQDVSVPWGTQLENWFEATRQRNAIREANTQTALSLLALGGSLVASGASHGSGARALGGLVAISATAALFGKQLQADQATAEGVALFPESHLFGGPIDVPPALFVKRWIVLNTPADPRLNCLTSVIMTYLLNDQTWHRVRLDFRYPSAPGFASEWQRKVCRP